MWEQIRVAYTQTSEACLGCRKEKRKKWISANTWQAIESRRALKTKVRQQYQEAVQTVKRMTRADEGTYMEDPTQVKQKRPPTGEQKNSCATSPSFRLWINKEGYSLTSEAEQEAGWAEHFSEVLSRPPPTIEAEVQDPDIT